MNGGKGAPSTLRLFVDTNVWLDYFLARTPEHKDVLEIFTKAGAEERFVLYAAALSLKDVAYIVESTMKRHARDAGLPMSESLYAAARETAWGCVRSMMNQALIVPIGSEEALQAFTLKGIHDDFEDNLILTAAQKAQAHYLITYDKKLAAHSPLPAVSPREMLHLLGRFKDGI